MACKTMLRQLLSKWGILSIDMQKAHESDGKVIGENGEVTFSDEQIHEEVTENDISVIETTHEKSEEPLIRESFDDILEG